MAEALRRALVVEDDEDIRDVVSMLLTVLGFDVREAGNGQAAQRKTKGASNVPVIVLSARRPPFREVDGEFQVAEILPKPFELDSFLAAVSRHCPEALEKSP